MTSDTTRTSESADLTAELETSLKLETIIADMDDLPQVSASRLFPATLRPSSPITA